MGTIVGERSGFVIGISLCNAGNHKILTILLRYPAISDISALRNALKKNFRSMFSFAKRVTVKNTHAEIRWTYSVRKPGLDDIAALIDQFVQALTMNARPFDGRCEDCGNVRTSELTLFNDIPGYHCSACQQRTISDRQQQSVEYGGKSMDFIWGFFWAAMTGIGCALVTGLGEYLFDEHGKLAWQVLIAFPVLTGMFVGFAFGKRVGRLDLRTQGVALFVLVLACNWLGEVCYGTLYLLRTYHIGFTAQLPAVVFRNLMRYRSTPDGAIIQAVQLLGAFVSVGFARLQRPNFRAEFVSLSEAKLRAVAPSAGALSIL